MTLVVSPKFVKALLKKPPELQAAIKECISRLEADPRAPGLHCHRVQGAKGVWEAYVDDGNRLTYHYEKGAIVLRNHCNHDILKRSP